MKSQYLLETIVSVWAVLLNSLKESSAGEEFPPNDIIYVDDRNAEQAAPNYYKY